MQWTCSCNSHAPILLLLLALLLLLNSNTVSAHPLRRRRSSPSPSSNNNNNWLPNPLSLGQDATAALTWLDHSANQLSNNVVHGLNSALPPDPNTLPSPPSPPPPPSTTSPDKNYGIAYSPYTAEGTCKPAAQITHDLAQLTGYALVRIYGTDCDQTRLVLSAARGLGLQVFAGLFDLRHFPDDLALIIAAVGGDWGAIHTVAIGNELLNSGQNTAAEVVGAVQAARATLRAAGYPGPVVAVDTVAAHLANPAVCAASDYCAANCHAFFDEEVEAAGAGAFVRGQVGKLLEMMEGDGDGDGAGDTGQRKKVVITESGWPHAGQPNGKAVPSLENQRAAVRSLREAFARSGAGAGADADPKNGEEDGEVGLVLFSSFDDLWKVDNGYTFGAEKFWGILGH
ncbi:putative cell wall glucanase (Scw4) [Aspergillus aculeatinus CBS 121060]|uniref:Glycoside hydrolase n=1 Tax=Aspergillus aculeatinus CBS 121060 TaxID=1448322 RepID=A0ACD1HFF8_9EURO|nr:glycoside hydrolase [Aspergillus aculeatinus CBS 121060]RAH72244.1 glycoside hydrolase [Aspergillus aculeatinus CBS 121060]